MAKNLVDGVGNYISSKYEPVEKLINKFNKVADSVLDGCGDKIDGQVADTLIFDASLNIGHYYLIQEILEYHKKNEAHVKAFVKRLAIQYGVIEDDEYDE